MIRGLAYIYFGLIAVSAILMFPGPVPKVEQMVNQDVEVQEVTNEETQNLTAQAASFRQSNLRDETVV